MRRLRQLRTKESGFGMIEVLVSALIVVMGTAAVVQTLTATGRASTEERHRAQAFSVAQEDQSRLRAMKISTLQQGLTPRVVTVDGTPFTVKSSATYVSDKSGGTQCGGEGKADYIQIGSSVTWPTQPVGAQPVTIESILAPTSGSVDSTSGGLAIALLNSRSAIGEKNGIAGVPLSGSGPATFFGSTNSKGCALFGNQPVGTYMVTPSLPGTGWVDPEGNPPKPFEASVSSGSTSYTEKHFDHGGELEASFLVYPKGGSVPATTKGDSILVTNTAIPSKAFGTPGGSLQSSVRSTSLLYPFEAGYSVRGGSCTVPKKPELEPEPAAMSTAVVTQGGTGASAVKVKVLLPALYLTVKNSGVTAEKNYSSNALVTLTDLNCKNSKGESIVRKYTTTSIGSLGEYTTGTEPPKTEVPGVPTGEYEICASKNSRHFTVEKPVIIKSVKGISLPIDLNASGWLPGEC